MFIGEAAGKIEEDLGRPFVGPAGQLLDKILHKMNVPRDSVYITNVVKCHPKNEHGSDRAPTIDEMYACDWIISQEISFVNPRVIVALGGIAAKKLTGNYNLRITKERGTWYEYNGIPLMLTFHPAYVLHSQGKDPGEISQIKWGIWNDIQEAVRKSKEFVVTP